MLTWLTLFVSMLIPEINLRWSRQHASLLIIVLSLALGVVIFLSIALIAKLMLLSFILYYGWRLMREVLLLDGYSLLKLRYEHGDRWCLTTADHEEKVGVLCGDSIVTQKVLLLRFNINRRVISYVIFKDAVNKEYYRQLLVLLRLRFTG